MMHIFCGIVGKLFAAVSECVGGQFRWRRPCTRKRQRRIPDSFCRGLSVHALASGLAPFHCPAGAGVLALPRSVAWLGWIAGPALLVIFYLISLLTSM